MNNTKYIKPEKLSDVIELMNIHRSQITFIAGGTDLLPQIRNRLKSPELIVDISEIEELLSVTMKDDVISVGAAVKMVDIASNEIVSSYCPILASAAGSVGNPLTRNRATIGGNLSNCSPCADTGPPLLTLNATVTIYGPDEKKKEVSLQDFFVSYKTTNLQPGELVGHINIPKPLNSAKGSFTKYGHRNSAAVSVVSFAMMLEQEKGTCIRLRLAMGGMAPIPTRAIQVENLLAGKKITAALIKEAAETIKQEFTPISDIRGSESYRRHLTGVLFERNMNDCLEKGDN